MNSVFEVGYPKEPAALALKCRDKEVKYALEGEESRPQKNASIIVHNYSKISWKARAARGSSLILQQ